MKLTIGKPTLSQELLDSYFLTISTYDGDADGSDAFRVLGFKPDREDHLQLLSHLLTTLQKVKEAYPMGRGGEELLSTKVPFFETWFGYDYLDASDFPASADHLASTPPATDPKLTLATKLTRELDFRWEPFATEEADEFLTWAPLIWAFREDTAHLYGAGPLDSPKGVWPLDSTLIDFSGAEASLSSFTVGYFDEVGRECKVEFEL